MSPPRGINVIRRQLAMLAAHTRAQLPGAEQRAVQRLMRSSLQKRVSADEVVRLARAYQVWRAVATCDLDDPPETVFPEIPDEARGSWESIKLVTLRTVFIHELRRLESVVKSPVVMMDAPAARPVAEADGAVRPTSVPPKELASSLIGWLRYRRIGLHRATWDIEVLPPLSESVLKVRLGEKANLNLYENPALFDWLSNEAEAE